MRANIIRHLRCLIIAGIICAEPAQAQSDASTAEVVRLFMRGVDGDTDFRLTITDTPALHRRLEIRCVRGCEDEVVYREDNSEYPIAAFRLWDGTPKVTTIWVGGSAYLVEIFKLDAHGITKIFEQGTKSAPQFGWTLDDEEIIVLDDRDRTPTDIPIRGTVWKWTGNAYERIRNAP